MRCLQDRYELIRLLGTGGMAHVHLAWDRVLGRQVAVKIVPEHLAADPVVRKRLLREARAAASFSHPHAVRVFDVGEADGAPFIVMEPVEGVTLARVLAERGALPVAEAVTIADGVLQALGAAHRIGLVHRDVKPANILLPDDGPVKLADFGIAKGVQQPATELTATGQVLGTPRYLAPEQAAGRTPVPASDVYALGVVLYELLAGRPPFEGDDPLAVAIAHQRQDPPPLGHLRPEVPDALAAVVHRALGKQPAERFANASEMRAALRAAAHDARHATRSMNSLAKPHPAPTTRQNPAQPGAAARQETSRLGVSAAALGLLSLAALALGFAFDGLGQGGAPSVSAEPSVQPDAAATQAPATPLDPGSSPVPSDSAPEATTVDENAADSARERLQAAVQRWAADPEALGEKGEALVDKAEDLLEEDDGDRELEKEARELATEVDQWVAEGKLDAAVGDEAVALLDAVIAESRQARSPPGDERPAHRDSDPAHAGPSDAGPPDGAPRGRGRAGG